MPLPKVTHLQFIILDFLFGGQRSGKQIRDALLSHHDVNKSGPAFYQLMARLEEAKFVDGKFVQQIVDSQLIKERVYKITSEGTKAFEETAEFYRNSLIGVRYGI